MILPTRENLEGRRFLRHFREDCAFFRVLKWDDIDKRWDATSDSGPMKGTSDLQGVSEAEIVSICDCCESWPEVPEWMR